MTDIGTQPERPGLVARIKGLLHVSGSKEDRSGEFEPREEGLNVDRYAACHGSLVMLSLGELIAEEVRPLKIIGNLRAALENLNDSGVSAEEKAEREAVILERIEEEKSQLDAIGSCALKPDGVTREEKITTLLDKLKEADEDPRNAYPEQVALIGELRSIIGAAKKGVANILEDTVRYAWHPAVFNWIVGEMQRQELAPEIQQGVLAHAACTNANESIRISVIGQLRVMQSHTDEGIAQAAIEGLSTVAERSNYEDERDTAKRLLARSQKKQ